MFKLKKNTRQTIIQIKKLIYEINEITNETIDQTNILEDDVERETLRRIRDANISTAQIITELEMRELIWLT